MAGIDILNQFPNSMMANAVRLGQSQFRSVDAPTTPVGAQRNIAIASSTALTIPSYTDKYGTYAATYAVLTAVGGPAYYTLDGTTPSPTNYAGTLAQGSSVPFSGAALAALRIIGTNLSVQYMR